MYVSIFTFLYLFCIFFIESLIFAHYICYRIVRSCSFSVVCGHHHLSRSTCAAGLRLVSVFADQLVSISWSAWRDERGVSEDGRILLTEKENRDWTITMDIYQMQFNLSGFMIAI